MTDNCIKILNRNDERFPWFLANMEDAPAKLYCIGDVSLLDCTAAAVVGARKCTEYGKQTALKIGRTLAENNIVTVSGMALGIDSMAHWGALRAGGKTIAVLGSGIDVCYPASNRKLYEQICDCGLVLSEYEPGSRPKPWQFPLRNRIISALADIVAVVEAGSSSGSLITAVKAAEQGKEVMCVPGNITSLASLGTNRLIRDGAGIITSPDDIIEALGISPALSAEEKHNMGADEKQIFAVLRQRGEMSLDALCTSLAKNPSEVTGILAVMELKGLISYCLGKVFIAKL